jgi:outer membrane protein OmpA-like peptidoglycan-associated protein
MKFMYGFGFVLACTAMCVTAQTSTPSTEQMIEQLKAPRSRSMARNAGMLASAPSLSLLVEFDFDSATVRPESRQALVNLAQALQSSDLVAASFAVQGHTDAKGSAEYNLRLSAQRAQAVGVFLAGQGVEAERLIVEGKGSTELADPGNPFAPSNRRVRIVNLN